MAVVTVRAAGERSLARRHPWVFPKAIGGLSGVVGPGETVTVAAGDGRILGRAAYSPHSQIVVRMWSFDPDEEVDHAFFRRRLAAAISGRASLLDASPLPGVRLVNAESDGLPGVIVDRYAGWLSLQLLSAGAERWREEIVSALVELTGCEGVWERSDADVRAKEHLAPRTGCLWGAEPPELVAIEENGCRFLVDLRGGHKTGFYLDQRDSRRFVASVASGCEVLNCFSYSGSFTVAALRGGARRVTNLDSSAAALALGQRNLAANALDPASTEDVEGNAFGLLRELRDSGRSFDLVILDPPKFVESRHQLPRACRGYKDVNLLGFKLLRPGGTLITFSCSGLLSPELFQKIVADAALDCGRAAQIVHRLHQASDHPTALNFPEGSYLKGLVVRAVESSRARRCCYADSADGLGRSPE